MQDQKQKTIYAVVGGVAVLGLAGIVYYLSRSKSEAVAELDVSELDKQLMEQIKQLGEPKYNGSELEFNYLLKFCEVVAKHAKLVQEQRKGSLVQDRRAALEKGDEALYKDFIKQMMDMEQEITDQTLDFAAKCIEMSGTEIEDQIQGHTQDQMKGYQLMQLQQEISTQTISKDLQLKLISKEEAMQVFTLQQEEQLKQMDSMMQNQAQMREMMMQGGGNAQDKQKELMLTILLEQTKGADRIFKKTGVEAEQLEQAIKAHNLEQDPVFKRTAQEYMQKIQMRAMQAQMSAGGGMQGGMPGFM